MDERALIDKLQAIEALHAGATTDGERVAADRARLRILERMEGVERDDPPVEYRFSIVDPWARRLFVALLRRYDLRPYRYRKQRRQTVMVRVSERFVEETLWPEFTAIEATMRDHLDEVTRRVIAESIHGDCSEASVVAELPGVTQS